MKNIKSEIIKYSKMMNINKLSALRSGNISSRYKNGFLITPSGKKYSSLKKKESHLLSGSSIKIFTTTKKTQKQLFMHIQQMLQQFLLIIEEFHHFIIWLLWQVDMTLNAPNMQPLELVNYQKIF